METLGSGFVDSQITLDVGLLQSVKNNPTPPYKALKRQANFAHRSTCHESNSLLL
jgi:hypothetical protein